MGHRRWVLKEFFRRVLSRLPFYRSVLIYTTPSVVCHTATDWECGNKYVRRVSFWNNVLYLTQRYGVHRREHDLMGKIRLVGVFDRRASGGLFSRALRTTAKNL